VSNPISGKIIVITGASSGIGRATAIAAGKQGASVALLARSMDALLDAAGEVERAGGRALTIATDVSDFAQVRHAAERTIETFGRIDAWVNNAAVYAVVPFEHMTPEEFERVIQVNFLGTVFGAKAVLPHFIERGEGALINVSSVVATRSAPLISAYCASKHAIKGFTESLQLEMAHNHPGISVVHILPASMNTPLFTHALARIGSKPRPFPPIYDPHLVADVILDSIQHPKRDIFVGSGRSMAMTEGIAPTVLDRAMLTGGAAFRIQQSDQPDDEMNNLFAPMPSETYAVYGEFSDKMRRDSLGTRLVEMHPKRARAMAGLGLAALALTMRRRGR
jgi:NAD(P)-dependent dehydrogenase (short-subunit alcohol dehydrogenase family)